MQIRDRIKELRRVKASDLIPNPKNWRTHPVAQQDALRGVLAEVGYADALLARETAEGLMLVDGHLRAETTPDSEVPVLVLDINEAEADLMLATLDPLAAMAGRDEARLAELLATVSSDNKTVNNLLESLVNGYEPFTLQGENPPLEDGYSQTIETPIYNPVGPMPSIGALADRTKVDIIAFQMMTELPDLNSGLTIKKQVNETKGCTFPFKQLVVDYEGDILPCCKMGGKKLLLGNIDSMTLQEAWSSDKMRDLQLMHKNNRWHENPVCDRCISGPDAEA